MNILSKEELIKITNLSILEYITKLEDIKNTYKNDLDNFISISKLYENINKNRYGFIIEFNKSTKSKKDKFKDNLNILYKDDKHINRLLNELEDTYNLLNRGYKINLKFYNKFINDLENTMSKLCIKLNTSELYRLEKLINNYIDLSFIFGKKKINNKFNIDKYIELINELELDKDIKLQVIELGIKDLLYVNNYEEEYELEEYNDLIPKLDDIVLDII